ncbi:MAG TPA: hypothetical protein PLX89_02210 [Verrucomicrobiota bacterium]|nr:hypothetical protein [Verrucomicrobiales bacterium]HRI11792.1 hypothetical protein [Verrucomicrobiota bacterium]
MTTKLGFLAPACTFSVLTFTTAFAEPVMLSPAAVIGSDLLTCCAETPRENMINHSGIETPFTSGVTLFDTYFADPLIRYAMSAAANNWQSEGTFSLPLHGFVDFDLGSSWTIHQLAIWNISLENVAIQIAEEPTALGSAPVAGEFHLSNNISAFNLYRANLLKFSTPQRGRYLRLDIKSAYAFQGINFAAAIVGELVASVTPPSNAPTVSIVATSDGGAVVSFQGTLQSCRSLGDAFEDVPGHPTGQYVIPSTSASPQFFRAVTN